MILPNKQYINNYDLMKTPFVLFQSDKNEYDRMSKQIGVVSYNESKLYKSFFSDKNINLIQKQIIATIFKHTNGAYLIEAQDNADLMTVMKSVFMQRINFLNINITDQIKELNSAVVNEVMPSILSEIKAYVGYIDNVFGDRHIMDRPQNVSTTGSKKCLPSWLN